MMQYHCYKKCPLSKASVTGIGDEDSLETQPSEKKRQRSSKSKASATSAKSKPLTRLNYPILHSALNESMPDFCFSLTPESQPLFDDSQPYFLASTGSLEPTEKPLMTSRYDTKTPAHSASTGGNHADIPQLPTVSSRIRWDHITNP
jgi:hypothetical protein